MGKKQLKTNNCEPPRRPRRPTGRAGPGQRGRSEPAAGQGWTRPVVLGPDPVWGWLATLGPGSRAEPGRPQGRWDGVQPSQWGCDIANAFFSPTSQIFLKIINNKTQTSQFQYLQLLVCFGAGAEVHPESTGFFCGVCGAVQRQQPGSRSGFATREGADKPVRLWGGK